MGTLFVLLNGLPAALTDAPIERDAFTWWSEIYLPAALGLATVFVSIAAIVASGRATRLAHQVEQERELAEAQRLAEERRRRVTDMSITEARALTAWVFLDTESWSARHRKYDEVGPDRHVGTAKHRARVMLEQSLVPGAQDLLEITELELDMFRSNVPDPSYMPDARWSAPASAYSDITSQAVPTYRRDRILTRIRSWALDPKEMEGAIGDALDYARSQPSRYWDYREGLGIDGLPAAEDLPPVPNLFAERIPFLIERGLLPEHLRPRAE
ncbi:hypothetical protein [Microbacterium hominis]|uniref:hypothetical protein n=1 Tax=Microbacterium hominis TaxID=162426 RepID=UPI001F06BCD2|nr:hypothetical protein [Microbacterium hominis]